MVDEPPRSQRHVGALQVDAGDCCLVMMTMMTCLAGALAA